MSIPRLAVPTLWALCFLCSACDDADKGAEGKSAEKTVEEAADAVKDKIESDAKEAAEDLEADDGNEGEKEEDKGTASMKIGDVEWTAERAKARVRDGGRVAISASRMDMDGKTAARQELKLELEDFNGPGTYKGGTTSMFVGVGFDMKEAKETKDDDAKAAKVAKKALMDAKTMLLMNASIEVTEATDDYIDGTFEWKPSYGDDPPITDGKFHAVIDK